MKLSTFQTVLKDRKPLTYGVFLGKDRVGEIRCVSNEFSGYILQGDADQKLIVDGATSRLVAKDAIARAFLAVRAADLLESGAYLAAQQVLEGYENDQRTTNRRTRKTTARNGDRSRGRRGAGDRAVPAVQAHRDSTIGVATGAEVSSPQFSEHSESPVPQPEGQATGGIAPDQLASHEAVESRSLTEAELKPCPFCGGEPEYERQNIRGESCVVVCTNCGCRLESNEAKWTNGWSWNKRK